MTALALAAAALTLGALAACSGGGASAPSSPAASSPAPINGAGPGVYPTINYEYAIVSISQASAIRAQDLRAFLSWAISTGTAQLARVNFQPLPPSVVMLSQAQIAKIEG